MEELVKFLRNKVVELKETEHFLREDLDDAQEENIMLRIEIADLKTELARMNATTSFNGPDYGIGHVVDTMR